MTTDCQLSVHQALVKVQQDIKVPKDKFNSFGKYHYRNAESILDAAKKLAAPLGCHITLVDQIETIGDRYYVKSTATFSLGDDKVSVSAYAREELDKKGMDGSQVTGASSSYARKYALNGLFAIDDGIDSDTTNDGSNAPPPKAQGKPPAKTQPKVQQSAEVVAAGKKLKDLADQYGKTDAAKTAPVKALLFDMLKKNGMSGLGDLGTCNNVLVFNELIDVLELALGNGVSA